MKKYAILLLTVFFHLSGFAQTDGFSVKILLPQDNIPVEAKTQLFNKLRQIATNYGMVDDGIGGRFVLTADVLTTTRDIVPSTPPRISQKIEVILYVGDVVESKVYSSLTLPATGVGQNDNKAYINAFQRIPVRSDALSDWMKTTKEKIYYYYQMNGAGIVARAGRLAELGEYDDAMSELLSIPDFCPVSSEAWDLAVELRQKKLDKEGEELLRKAKNRWASGQDEVAAQEALEIISTIDLASSSAKAADDLATSIAKQLNSRQAKKEEEKQRQWAFQMKQYEDDLALRRKQVEAQTALELAKEEAIRSAAKTESGDKMNNVEKVIKEWFEK